MRRDHAPIVDVQLRVTADFRDDALRERFAKALRDQEERDTRRRWREAFATRRPAPVPKNVIAFGSAAKS